MSKANHAETSDVLAGFLDTFTFLCPKANTIALRVCEWRTARKLSFYVIEKLFLDFYSRGCSLWQKSDFRIKQGPPEGTQHHIKPLALRGDDRE